MSCLVLISVSFHNKSIKFLWCVCVTFNNIQTIDCMYEYNSNIYSLWSKLFLNEILQMFKGWSAQPWHRHTHTQTHICIILCIIPCVYSLWILLLICVCVCVFLCECEWERERERERPPAYIGFSERRASSPWQTLAGCPVTIWSSSTPKTLKQIVNSATIFARLPIFEI